MMYPHDPDDDGDIGDPADAIAVLQCVLIALLLIGLIVLTPVAHPEWFNSQSTSGTTPEKPF